MGLGTGSSARTLIDLADLELKEHIGSGDRYTKGRLRSASVPGLLPVRHRSDRRGFPKESSPHGVILVSTVH